MSQENKDIDLGDAEMGDSTDPDFVDEMPESFPVEPPMEEEPMPMEEEPTPMEEEPEETASPFDSEFKTISTSNEPMKPMPEQQQEEEDDEPVLFPDASETRAKKVGYY
jgi:hypothetical protein